MSNDQARREENTVAVTNMMDPLGWLRQHLAELDPDLVRSMLATFAEELVVQSCLISADPAALSGILRH